VHGMTSEWFSVDVETRAPEGAANLTDEDAADRLMDLLEAYAGVVSAAEASWSATVSVQAQNAAQATISGAVLVEEMASKAGMPAWPQVRAAAVRDDVLEEENQRPTLPELVSAPEAADILGVSPQRVHELARGGRGFPSPIYELKVGKLWLRDAIVAFDERWERKPGRPDKVTVMKERVASALLKVGTGRPDIIFLPSEGVAVIVQIKAHGSPSAQRHRAVAVIDALHRDGLGITAESDHLVEEVEDHLASGRPARVFDLAEDPSGTQR
jgi:hypothetical protein